MQSSIVKKVLMALSGIFLMIFLLQHLSINLTSLIPDGGKTFNTISHFMGYNPLVQFVLQPILIFGVFFHFIMGLVLEYENRVARKQKYVYSDNQYYLQSNRKLMIRRGDYKYIYNKRGGSEELYDLSFDPRESVNLLLNSVYNLNREKNYFLEEVYFYPKWSKAKKAYIDLKAEKNRIWKEGFFYEKILFKLKEIKSKKFSNIYRYIANKNIKKGRWNSFVKQLFYEK